MAKSITVKIDAGKTKGNIASNRKEKDFSRQLTVAGIYKGEIMTPVIARIYSTNARHYACVWSSGNIYLSGGGFAGGYGYHRASAALQSALNNAGVFLSEAIDGRGDTAMNEALLALAKVNSSCKSLTVIEAHA